MELNWLTIAIGAACLLLYFYYRKKRHDFRQWGIPQLKEVPIIGIVGNGIFRRQHITEILSEVYNLNQDAKYTGMHSFMTPLVVVRDLDLAKTVLVKDFDHFSDHPSVPIDENVEPLFAKNLFQLTGQKWKELRNLLSPSFTSTKMKAMFHLMEKCAENFTKSFIEQSKGKEEVDVKDAFSKYTNDVIATCAFGIEIDSMKDPTNEFFVNGKAVTKTDGITTLVMIVKFVLITIFPSLTKYFGMRILPEKVTSFFINIIGTTVKTRDEKGIERPDMLQLMMSARGKTSENLKLDIVEMTAQAFIFFGAGFETTSSQLSLIAYELAAHPEVQEKLQAEIDAIAEENDGKVDYDALSHMPYFDAVFQEILRLHPQVAFLNRVCTKPYELPPTLPNAKPYELKVGAEVYIPASTIHRDPRYYDEPDKFDPERFMGKKITTVDILNLGFGMGPRMCIGNRFAILESKVLLFHLLRKCSFQPCAKTDIPLRYAKSKLTPVPVNGFWLKVKER